MAHRDGGFQENPLEDDESLFDLGDREALIGKGLSRGTGRRGELSCTLQAPASFAGLPFPPRSSLAAFLAPAGCVARALQVSPLRSGRGDDEASGGLCSLTMRTRTRPSPRGGFPSRESARAPSSRCPVALRAQLGCDPAERALVPRPPRRGQRSWTVRGGGLRGAGFSRRGCGAATPQDVGRGGAAPGTPGLGSENRSRDELL